MDKYDELLARLDFSEHCGPSDGLPSMLDIMAKDCKDAAAAIRELRAAHPAPDEDGERAFIKDVLKIILGLPSGQFEKFRQTLAKHRDTTLPIEKELEQEDYDNRQHVIETREHIDAARQARAGEEPRHE